LLSGGILSSPWATVKQLLVLFRFRALVEQRNHIRLFPVE